MGKVQSPKPVSGKIVIVLLLVGSVVFTILMSYTTYFGAKLISPLLQKPGTRQIGPQETPPDLKTKG